MRPCLSVRDGPIGMVLVLGHSHIGLVKSCAASHHVFKRGGQAAEVPHRQHGTEFRSDRYTFGDLAQPNFQLLHEQKIVYAVIPNQSISIDPTQLRKL